MVRPNIQIYKKKYIHKMITGTSKVVIFDLDETIGCFTDLEVLWSGIKKYCLIRENGVLCDQTTFNAVLDLYPEFLRYGILNVLDYLNYKKKSGSLLSVYIYTNNQLPKKWSEMIVRYVEHKQGIVGLFERIINAFKINKQVVEINRTSHTKTHNDFIRCSLLPKTTELCFIDDSYFTKMHNNKIYYIQPRPYYHGVSTSDMIERMVQSNMFPHDIDAFLHDYFVKNNTLSIEKKNVQDVETDLVVSRKIMYHIQEFFHLTVKRTITRKKRTLHVGRFTRKRII
jgi:hypothetical protein